MITVCDNAREHCPIFPETYKYIYWNIQDAAAVQGTEEEKLAAFRKVRDEIASRVERFVQETQPVLA